MKLSEDEQRLEDLRSMYSDVGFPGREAWKSAPAIMQDGKLKILGHPVMEDWEVPYMKKLAEIASSKGGHVLEVGFGLGIASEFIQKAKVAEHTIIEANHDIAEHARKFCQEKAKSTTKVLEGLWEDFIDHIPDNSLDGILHDAYPLEESEVMNQAHFAKIAYRKLKPGGVFTYFSDEIHRFKDSHMAQLLEAGFKQHNIRGEVVPVEPPQECQYWNAKSILAPTLIK